LVFGDLTERGKLAAACIGEQDVDPSGLVPHNCKEPVEIAKLGNVAPNAAGLAPSLGDRGVKLLLAPARQEDVSALSRKPLCRGKTDAAARASDDGDLSFEPAVGLALVGALL